MDNGGDAVGALFGAGFMMTVLMFAVGMYIVFSLPVYTIAKKAGHDMAWLAFVPIANLWLMLDVAGLSGWLILLMLVPLANVVLIVYTWMKLAERMGHPSWLGLLLMVPLANIIMPFYVAYSDTGRMRI